ncbi:MAG: protein BatD [Flavobacteriales bacterium]|nr:protein BatD [Flavobacteriales bacterium]
MKRNFLIILFSLSSLIASAGSVNFTVKLSHTTVEVGQRFQVTFTVNSKGGSFTPPSFGKLQLSSGPNQSQSMQYVNGNVSQNTSISYVLLAREKGNINIGAASIKVDGETYRTKAVKLEVVESNPNGSNAQRNKQSQRKSTGEQLDEYVFVKAIVDKKSAYVGEKVTVTYKLYSKLTLSGINLEAPPSFNGFWTQDIQSLYDKIQLSREQINGEVYQVAELQQTLLYPQRSGNLIIDPMSIKATVQVQSRRARSIFEQMFGSYENKEVITKSKAITLKVYALPQKGKPTNFSGAVGKFRMKMKTNKDSLTANESINITVEISGTGNLPLINAPKLDFPSDFEVYDPETKNSFKTNASGASGKKTFDYLVIPRHAGEFKLKPYEFTYFDIASKSYKTIGAKPILITVAKGDDEENVVFSGSRKEKVELLNTDIRHIHLNNLSLVPASDFFYDSLPFYLTLLFLVVLAIVLYFASNKFKERSSDTIGIRKSKANKQAKKRLATAKKFLDAKDDANFYEEISTALFGYFSDKFIIDAADLSQDKIVHLLDEHHYDNELQHEVKLVLEEADMARFAPDSSINPTILYEKSAEIISKMESKTT